MKLSNMRRELQFIQLPTGDKVLQQFTDLEKILNNTGALMPYGEESTPAQILNIASSDTLNTKISQIQKSKQNPTISVEPDIVLAIRTSGSTGVPKVILHTSTAICASLNATKTYLGGNGQWLLAIPPQYIGGLQVLLRSIDSGTTPTFLENSKFNTKNFLTATKKLHHNKKYTALVPTQLKILLSDPQGIEALQHFNAILIGGDATDQKLAQIAKKHHINLILSYGMSETCGGCVYNGTPLPGIEISLDSNNIIRIRGPQVSTRYIAYPYKETLKYPESWLQTSDIGAWKNGTLSILGRSDDIIASGGIKISTTQIEKHIIQNFNTTKCYAMGIKDEIWGHRLVLFTTDPTLKQEEIKKSITQHIGKHAAPKQIILLTKIPLLENGKIARQILTKIAHQNYKKK